MVVQSGGLRTCRQVLDHLSRPVIFVVETGFLFAVTVHALLGLRGVLFDLGPRARRRIDAGLRALGTLTVGCGPVLLVTLAAGA